MADSAWSFSAYILLLTSFNPCPSPYPASCNVRSVLCIHLLHPTFCILSSVACILQPALCSFCSASHILQPSLCIHPAACVLHPRPCMLSSQLAFHISQSASCILLASCLNRDLLGSAHSNHPALSVCLLIDTWDDTVVLPSGGHIHWKCPVGHSEGLCMSSWQLEFGWHVFCSLACWDGGRNRGIDGP